MHWMKDETSVTIRTVAAEIKFVLHDEVVKGVGSVVIDGVPLRNLRECVFPQIATPRGMEVCHYTLGDVFDDGDAVVVRTHPCFRVGHRQEWTEHALHALVSTASWTRDPYHPEGAYLDWVIRETAEVYDGVEFRGFSYGFRYHCPGHAIYQIEDKATWEIGGTVENNLFVMRGASRPFVSFDENQTYFSGVAIPDIANPAVFQHLPLYAQLQGFTFQADAARVLITVHDRPSHVRSLFQRDSGQPVLLHFNQFCFDLAESIETPARKVLLGTRRGTTRVELLNHYLRIREAIQADIRQYYGVKLDRTRPTAHVETWDIAQVTQFDDIFSRLQEWGFPRAFLMPLWRSNETDVRPRFAGEYERFGVLGNMCCPLELEIAECYGGWNGLREILSHAAACGVEVYMWFGSHFSSLSPLSNDIPELFARDVSGQHNRNNYGHVLFAVDQNNDAYRRYLIDRFRKARECGLSGVFRDSHFNMACDTITYSHQGNDDIVRTMHDAEVSIQRTFQHELEMLYYVESQGVLGTPMCGTSYEEVRGYEFLYSDMDSHLDEKAITRFGDDPTEAFFRGLSVRLMYQLAVEVNTFPSDSAFSSWWTPETMVPLIKAFQRVEPYLVRLSVLDDDRGVRWDATDASVVFAYRDFLYELDTLPRAVSEVVSQTDVPPVQAVAMERLGIYLIT